MIGHLRSELGLAVAVVTVVIFSTLGSNWQYDLSGPTRNVLLFSWLFLVMLALSFRVVHHADALAIKLGEPYGTLILTLAVISIEFVVIVAVMITGENNPALARDTMFSVLMIVLNGMLGVALLIGGMRHHQQEYNFEGAATYLGVIIPLAVIGLMIPYYTESRPGGEASNVMAVFLILMSIALYAVFLLMQTTRYRGFFTQPAAGGDPAGHHHHDMVVRGTGYHAILLVANMAPIVLLSKKLAIFVDWGMSTVGAPTALGGFLVAVLVLSPEGLAAFTAARDNQLQRTVNIALGSGLATIGLTIPAVLLVGFVTGRRVELGLEPVDQIILILTLVLAIVNFGGRRTNVLQGLVHVVVFCTYLALIFD
jgi:Ca2+:H+ antiporter